MTAGKKRATPADRLQRLRQEVPATLAAFSRQARAGLARLERQIAEGGQQSRQLSKRLVRTLRDVSHQVGRFEAYGERGWRARTLQVRAEAAKALRKLEKAIDPPKPRRKAVRKTARKAVGKTARKAVRKTARKAVRKTARKTSTSVSSDSRKAS